AQTPPSDAWLESARAHDWASDLDGLGLLDGTATGSGEFTSARTPPWWRTTVAEHWSPGCRAAAHSLHRLAEGVDDYVDCLEFPGMHESPPCPSPQQLFGEMSPMQALWAAQDLPSVSVHDRHALIRQLYWRDFSWHLTYHIPRLDSVTIQSEFAHLPSEDD